MKSIGAVLAVASVAIAQSTTSLWLIGFDQQNVQGSIIASDKTATTYSLACGASVTDSDVCGIPTSFTFTQGPSTVAYVLSAETPGFTETISLNCRVTNSASGVCTATYSGPPTDTGSTATVTGNIVVTDTKYITNSSDLGLIAVTITAGPTTTGTGAAKTTSGTNSSSSSPAAGASASSSKSTGAAAPLMTKAPWVGAAMGVGALALAAL